MGFYRLFEAKAGDLKLSKRTRICKKTPKGKKSQSCWFVVRDKNGRIVRWSNIGKSTRVDARVKAKRTVKKGKGRGHLGDIR